MTASAPTIPDSIAALAPQMTVWRHAIHAWPELGFEEEKTSALVIRELRALGLEVHTGLGGTGVVAVIDSGKPLTNCKVVVNHTIVLTEEEKAEAHAKAMQRATDEAYRKITQGKNKTKKAETATQSSLF